MSPHPLSAIPINGTLVVPLPPLDSTFPVEAVGVLMVAAGAMRRVAADVQECIGLARGTCVVPLVSPLVDHFS